jgi:hypothetical protein
MAEAKQAMEDLALLVKLCDRMADEGGASMYHADTLAQRNAVVRRLREFIDRTAGVSVVGSQPSSSHTTGKVRGTEGISFDPAQGPEVTGGEA